jgi:hypothetical protein
LNHFYGTITKRKEQNLVGFFGRIVLNPYLVRKLDVLCTEPGGKEPSVFETSDLDENRVVSLFERNRRRERPLLKWIGSPFIEER